jgi:hypothetical protein
MSREARGVSRVLAIPGSLIGVDAAETSYLVARLETLSGSRGISLGGGEAGPVCRKHGTQPTRMTDIYLRFESIYLLWH